MIRMNLTRETDRIDFSIVEIIDGTETEIIAGHEDMEPTENEDGSTSTKYAIGHVPEHEARAIQIVEDMGGDFFFIVAVLSQTERFKETILSHRSTTLMD